MIWEIQVDDFGRMDSVFLTFPCQTSAYSLKVQYIARLPKYLTMSPGGSCYFKIVCVSRSPGSSKSALLDICSHGLPLIFKELITPQDHRVKGRLPVILNRSSVTDHRVHSVGSNE